MTELQAPYLPENPFNAEQLKRIDNFMEFIKDNGGYGVIELIIKNSEIRFIALGKVSAEVVIGGNRNK